ncbi:glycoside hydrolase domain-containing protein [Marinifilum fragile]|uniref:glycoside hydrolase domain-containing protein n=1 Tax=Marinifilum fragile TaxID=570161 RepID=UPI0038B351F1
MEPIVKRIKCATIRSHFHHYCTKLKFLPIHLCYNKNSLLINGNPFVVNTINQSKENVFVDKVEVNGKTLNNFTTKHTDIINGSEITFYMNLYS